MAITYIERATNGGTTTSVTSNSIDYPATVNAGDLLLLGLTFKNATNQPNSTPSGWTAASTNGSGAGNGSDGNENEGTVALACYHKIAAGTEGGTSFTVSFPTGGYPLQINLFRLSGATGAWSVAYAKGSDVVADTSWSTTMDTDPGITVGDLVIVFNSMNSTDGSFSSQTLSAAGVTFGAMTERQDVSTTNGTNSRAVVTQHAITSGTSSGVATYTATSASSSTYGPTGVTVLVRLREAPSGLTITSVNTTNTAFSAQTDSAIVGTGLSASVVCTYAGIACANESASSSTSLKITFPNFFTNNIKLGRNYEFNVVG